VTIKRVKYEKALTLNKAALATVILLTAYLGVCAFRYNTPPDDYPGYEKSN